MAEKKKALAGASQMTNTRKKNNLDKDAVLNSFGGSGTALLNGFIEEEFNSKLKGSEGVKKFDEMRRTDAQVNAILMAMELPIRSTRWYVEPSQNKDGETDDAAWEVADFVEKAIFDGMETTWDDTLREMLTMLPFGFSVFEKVYKIKEDKITLKKLGYRKQSSIHKWETEDGGAGVTQYLVTPLADDDMGAKTVSIPAEKLLIFSYRREGDNYEGISVLRSAYKHWYIKDKLYKFDAVRHERQSVGIPVITLPNGATDVDKTEALTIVTNIRSTEQTGIVLPGEKWKFEFADTKASQSTDLFESIKHHNREIAKNILAQFLELGDTSSGSRSLGDSQTDMFLQSLEAVAKQICDTINRFLIPELVDFNFDVEAYPKLKFDPLAGKDLEKLANIISTLIGAAAINPDEDLEDFLREKYELPARMKEEEVDETDDGEDEDPMDDEGDDTDGGDGGDGGDMPDNTDDLDALDAELAKMSEDDEDDLFDASIAQYFGELEDMCDQAEEFAHTVSEETKKKISEKLKAYWARHGKVGDVADKANSKADELKSKSESVQAQYKGMVDGVRKSIDSLKSEAAKIPKGKKGAAQRAALAAKVKAVRQQIAELKGQAKGAKTIFGRQIALAKTTAKEAKKLIAARKKELQGAINSIRSEIKAGSMSLKDGLKPLASHIKSNATQIASIREQMKGVTDKDQKEALKRVIDGLKSETTSARQAMGSMREAFGGVKDSKNAQIEKLKADKAAVMSEDHQCGHGCSHGEQVGEFDEDYFAIGSLINNKHILSLQNEAREAHDFAEIKSKGWKLNEYEKDAWRPMTFAERKVNFLSLKRSVDTFEQMLDEKLNELAASQKEELLLQIKKAVEANDIAAVGKIKAKYTSDMAQLLTDIQKEMFEIGKKSAAVEMSVQVPATKAEVRGALRVQNDTIVDSITNDIETASKSAVTQVAAKRGGSITATTAAEAVAAASASLDVVYEKAKNAMKGLVLIGSINLGRASIFERYPEKIYAMQYSAILDSRTTETCRSLDGRIVLPGSPEFYKYSPPRHYGCRSLWVEILQEETFKPKITGIPSSIPSNATVDTFKDLKSPVILKGSPVVKVIQEEIADRKTKIAELETSGKYQNRIAQHQQRIDELEKSLESAFSEHFKEILKADGVSFKE